MRRRWMTPIHGVNEGHQPRGGFVVAAGWATGPDAMGDREASPPTARAGTAPRSRALHRNVPTHC